MDQLSKWDLDGRYKKIANTLVKQCAGENLTVEEAEFVLKKAIGEINRQGRCSLVGAADKIQSNRTDGHMQ